MPDRRLEIVLAGKDLTGKAFKSVQGRVGKLRASFTGLTSATGYLKAAFVGLAAAGVGGFVKKSLDAADTIGKTADVIGISTDALQEYRHAANLSGVSVSTMESSFSAFAKRVGEARNDTGALVTFLKKFDSQLLENIKSAKSTDEALKLVFERMAQTASQTDRAALASAAFSRAGVRMVNFVKDGADGLARMRKEAQELGLVLSENFIRASENANDQLEKLTRTLKTQATTAVIQFAPQIAEMAQMFTEAIVDMRKAQNDLAGDTAVDTWGENIVDTVAFAADAVHSGFTVISGAFQFGGKTIAAEMASIVAAMQGDFAAIKSYWSDWSEDIKDIFADLEKSGDPFRRKLAEIRERRRLLPEIKKDSEGLANISKGIDAAGKKLDQFKEKYIDWQKAILPDDADEMFFDPGAMFEARDEWRKEQLAGMGNDLDKFIEKYRDWEKAILPDDADDIFSDPGAMFEAQDEWREKQLAKSTERWEAHNQVLVDLTQETAESMRSTFSDVFFDAMTGELKSFKDYANAIFESIARSMSDLLAKQLTEGLFNTGAAGGGAAGGGSFFGMLGTLFAGLFHKGGIVGRDDPVRRQVPAAAFIGAPRLHAGLIPGEYPAILKRGEAVFTPNQLKALTGGTKRRELRVINNFNIQAPAGSVSPQTINQVQAALSASLSRANRRNN